MLHCQTLTRLRRLELRRGTSSLSSKPLNAIKASVAATLPRSHSLKTAHVSLRQIHPSMPSWCLTPPCCQVVRRTTSSLGGLVSFPPTGTPPPSLFTATTSSSLPQRAK